jgi:hypothetical protein
MTNTLKGIGWCCLAVLIALYIVGAVSHGSLRHVVQTLPLWFPIVLGFNRRESARWCAWPCLGFWLGIMVVIWLFLLGWAHLISGHFSPVEIAMTLIVGIGSAAGLAMCLWRARWSVPGTAQIIVFGVLQYLAFRISMIPAIAQR